MKFIKIGMKILLTLSLIIITMSFIVENIVIETFSQEILSKKVSGYFLDEIIYDIADINNIEQIEDSIRNSKYTNQITSKFINNIIENILYNKHTNLDISKEVNILILENMQKEINNEKVENTKKYLESKIKDTEKNLEDNLIYSFGDYYSVILKLYNLFTNNYFRLVMILLCIINICGLVILEKYKALKEFQITILITAIFTTIIFIIIKLLSNFIDQELAGGWLSDINLNLMIWFIIIEFLISFGIFIIRKIFNFERKK